jgi:hypothetical protein
MRKPPAATLLARNASSPKIGFGEAPVHWVCLALVLALVVLAGRIASVL